MNLTPVIQQIRNHCASFGGRVAGAARFKMLDETTTLTVPCAFVIPLDDNPGESMSANSVRMPLIDSFAVIVAVSNAADERGQAAIESAHDTLRAELWAALLGWRPDGLGADSRYKGLEYQGGNLLDLDRSRLWYQFDFGAYMEISPTDGWQQTELANLPHFDGMTINVDYVDPFADPNLQYPGPDGRIETVINIPPTGTLP